MDSEKQGNLCDYIQNFASSDSPFKMRGCMTILSTIFSGLSVSMKRFQIFSDKEQAVYAFSFQKKKFKFHYGEIHISCFSIMKPNFVYTLSREKKSSHTKGPLNERICNLVLLHIT